MNRIIVIKLKQLLKDRNMEQKELATITGLSVRTVSELVNNKTERIPKTALTKIANALELTDIRELIDLERVRE